MWEPNVSLEKKHSFQCVLATELDGDGFSTHRTLGHQAGRTINTAAERGMDRLQVAYKCILIKGHLIRYNLDGERAEIKIPVDWTENPVSSINRRIWPCEVTHQLCDTSAYWQGKN